MTIESKIKNKCLFHMANRLRITKSDVESAQLRGVIEPILDDNGKALDNKFVWSTNSDFTIEFDFENNTIKDVKYRYFDGENDLRLKAVFASILSGYASLVDLELPDRYPCTALMTDDAEIMIIGVTYVNRRPYLISDNLGHAIGHIMFDARGASQNIPKYNNHIVLLKE